MLTSVLYRLLCWVVGVLARGGGERELEIVVLRHQLAILRRGGKRPRYTTADRALLAAASRLLPPERFAVGPQTLRRWHRALLEGGRRSRRRRPGRSPLAAEPRSLIIRPARENPRWGYMRIQGELLKLGIGVSHTTIATVLRSSGLGPAPRRIGPTWSEFLRAQAHSMLGGGLRDSLDGDTLEPSDWAANREARQVEANDDLTPAEVAGPQLASQPLPVRSRQALPRQCVLPVTRGPSRLQPSHRSHARDGPPEQVGPCPTIKRSRAKVRSHRRSHPPSAPTTEPDPSAASQNPQHIGATDRPPSRVATVNRVSLPHRLGGEAVLAIREARAAQRSGKAILTAIRRGRSGKVGTAASLSIIAQQATGGCFG